MIPILYYLLKVSLISGVLFSYYWLVLRNKKFHQYNRLYLLGVSIFSWLIPLIKIGFVATKEIVQPAVIQIASVVADSNTEFEQVVVEKSNQFSWGSFFVILFIIISSLFLLRLILSLWKIKKWLNRYPHIEKQGLRLVLTDEKGTPFSFFKYIFWNNAIDMDSEIGKKMLHHELTHVKENHSFDKFIIELQLIIGWLNPFIWLLRKELYLIHEFIADQHSVENNDASVLATMLLTAAYPEQQHLISNPFFSPLKRRLHMITQPVNTKRSYVRKFFILPILSVLILLFAFRNVPSSNVPVAKLDKPYTIVIDAGHGGDDLGAQGPEGTKEKEMTLLIAQKIKAINNNPNLKVILTRNADKFISVKERSSFANDIKADLFISIHLENALDKKASGMELIIPKATNAYAQKSTVLATALQHSISPLFSENISVVRRENSIWVLDNTQMPSVILECGFISNENDRNKIKSNLSEIAIKILEGATSYLSSVH